MQFRVDAIPVSVHDRLDDAVLAVGLLLRLIEGPFGICFIFGEQQIARALAVKVPLPKKTMPRRDGSHVCTGSEDLEFWLFLLAAPRPGVPKPQGRQHVDFGGLWPAVEDGNLDEYVLRIGFGVLDEDVEVPV